MGDLLNLGCGCCGCEGFTCSGGPLELTAVEVIATSGSSVDCTCPSGGTFLIDSVQLGINCSSCSPMAETTCGPITVLEDECVQDGRHNTLPTDFDGPCVSSYSYYIYSTVVCCNWRIYDDFTFKQSACAQLSGRIIDNVNFTYNLLIQRDRKIIESRNTAYYRRLVTVTNSGPATNPYLCRFVHSWGGSWELDPAYSPNVECPADLDTPYLGPTILHTSTCSLVVSHAITIINCSDALGTVTVDEMSADSWQVTTANDDFSFAYRLCDGIAGCVGSIDYSALTANCDCIPTSVQFGGVGTSGP